MSDEALPNPPADRSSSKRSDEADALRDTHSMSVEVDVSNGHPGFATTAFGPGDVRDTPRMPTEDDGEPADPWIGRVLSNVYRVEAKIGEGGMGAVYSARHVHLGKQYAVKVLGAAIASNATAVERLKQEAIAASSIDHDNIVEVISFDRYADGAVFIVMEFLRGESLADRLERGPIPYFEALAIAHQIAAALGKAHEAGIVHRDLKPENLFLAKKGDGERVKVLDFGISKIKSADSEQVKMTRTGQLVGTPLYMSPEQARGETDVDRRVDVYALGVILYEMLTGSPPFEGRNYFELLWKHGNEEPQSLKQRNPNVTISDEVDAVVLRALAKRREERFQTMEELAAALAVAAPDAPVPVATASLPPRNSSPRTSTPTPSSLSSSPAIAAPREAARATTDELPAPPASKLPSWLLVAAAVLLVGGGGAIALSVGGGDTRAAAPEQPTPDPVVARPPADPAAEPDPATVPVPDPVPVPVSIALDSTPSGAEVRVGDRVLGTTPTFVDLPPGAPVTLLFHHDGYLDETEELIPTDGARISVRLRRRSRGGSSSSGDGSSLPIKTEL